MSKTSPRWWLCFALMSLSTNSCTAFVGSRVQRGKISFASSSSDFVSDFCEGTNTFWKQLVIPEVRDKVGIQPAFTAGDGVVDRLTAAPEVPGIPRPVWLTVLGSVPTALGWYGYYKFSVEEELFQHELATEGKVSGCGGYGTLFPFVYGVLVGGVMEVAHAPGGSCLIEAAGAWILLGQLNLYRRVNELVAGQPTEGGAPAVEPPLWAWWALLPPPLDVVVGLRQVHFLSQYWEYERAVLAEEKKLPSPPPPQSDPFVTWFPFIASPRFTLRKFLRTPSLWFAFTREWPDFDIPLLQEKEN